MRSRSTRATIRPNRARFARRSSRRRPAAERIHVDPRELGSGLTPQTPTGIEAFESVLAAAQAGAEWALTVLYRELHPRVLTYLSARERAEAEDVASEVWLDVASGLHRFAGDEAGFRAWAFTIARRRLLDQRRRAAVRKTTPTPREMLGRDRGIGNVEDEALAALGADEALARIADLPADQAEVVLLRVLGDLSVGDVAAILHKRPGAVRALQHRTLRRLARTVSREPVTD